VLTRPLEEGPLKGQAALVGALRGMDEGGRPLIEVGLRGGAHRQAVAMGDIKLAHLVYDPSTQAPRGRGEGKGSKAPPPRQRPGHGKRSE